jgi:beta-lactamase class A
MLSPGDILCVEFHRISPLRHSRAILIVFSAFLTTACASTAQQTASRPTPVRADTLALRKTLDSIADAHQGVVGYAVIDLATNTRMSRRGDEKFPTASLIKVPILVTVYDLVAKGQLSLDDPLTMLKIDKVPGSGIIQHLHDGMILTVRDAAYLMITISDNTATNLLLDRIIIRRVWAKMDSLGLTQTRVHSKSFLRNSSVAMDSSVKYGLGVTTPNEMARLFEHLAHGRAVSPSADSAMLGILYNTNSEMMMQRFAGGVRTAHKSGETNEVRTECSLFELPNRIVACVLTKENKDTRWIVDNEAQLTVARMGEAIVKAWRPPPAAP